MIQSYARCVNERQL